MRSAALHGVRERALALECGSASYRRGTGVRGWRRCWPCSICGLAKLFAKGLGLICAGGKPPRLAFALSALCERARASTLGGPGFSPAMGRAPNDSQALYLGERVTEGRRRVRGLFAFCLSLLPTSYCLLPTAYFVPHNSQFIIFFAPLSFAERRDRNRLCASRRR